MMLRVNRLGLSSILLLMGLQAQAASGDLKFIKLPKGFKAEIYVDKIPNARSLTLSPAGTLFVGTRSEGSVYAVSKGKVHTIAKGLNMPNGVALRGKDLYVAEVSRVIKFENIEKDLSHPPELKVVNDGFPKDTHHGWKFIAFGPDGKLYVPVGAPCNICESKDAKYASLMRMNPDGSGLEVYAHGIRNTVGFAWNPQDQSLWFTDNGRDHLGDNQPPDELNRIVKKGQHFGYPYCHAGDIADPEFGKSKKCSETVPPVQKLGPHVAALGMRFYGGKMFPKKYQGRIFIAEHGSWNRSQPLGYRIMTVTLKGNQVVDYSVFAEGWLAQGEDVKGRPVDLEVMPDGSLLVSDDLSGVIYRITYSP